MATPTVLYDVNGNALLTNSLKHLEVAKALPDYMQTRLLGQGWSIQTATLFAPLTAVPTTAAALEIFNNSTAGRLIVVESLFADQILSTAATQTYAIYAMVTTQKAVPSLTALAMTSTVGKAAITPTAASEIVTGVGTTVVANGWRPYGSVQSWGTAAATPGNSWEAVINGRIIVPPSCSLCLHIVGSIATASTFQVGVTFDLVTASVLA